MSQNPPSPQLPQMPGMPGAPAQQPSLSDQISEAEAKIAKKLADLESFVETSLSDLSPANIEKAQSQLIRLREKLDEINNPDETQEFNESLNTFLSDLEAEEDEETPTLSQIAPIVPQVPRPAPANIEDKEEAIKELPNIPEPPKKVKLPSLAKTIAEIQKKQAQDQSIDRLNNNST